MVQKKVHYIIIGAGSAGCVLANRLSANPNHQVLLIEAGGGDWNPWIHVPVGYFKTMHDPSMDWCYLTDPDPGIANRRLQWPRGKVMGGSSSLNGLLYVRGQAEDYDHWQELGNRNWSYQDVLPYFKKSEDQIKLEQSDAYHGKGGELKVSDLRLRRPIADQFIEAAKQTGIDWNDDYNGETQAGVSYFQQTAAKGFRCSSAKAFIRPIKGRKNLIVSKRSQVTRILIENQRAVGVEFIKDNQKVQYYAENEVVLCAGAIGSPQILQLSGIGSKQLLDQHSIQCHQDLPGVGENLQDHLQVRLVYKTNQRTLNDELNNWFKQMLVGLQYMINRTGALTLAASQVVVFTNSNVANDSNATTQRPDIQFHFQPLSADKPGEGVHPFSAFTASVCQLRPYSRGKIAIKSSNPLDYPSIQSNYLSDERDYSVVVNAVKVARKIASAPALQNSIIDEYVPGSQYHTDEQLLEAARQFSQTIYHPVGSCKMGHDQDSMAVVNDRLQVYGISNLRVADASIMPTIVSGNTNAPAIMIGEKASDMILQDNLQK